jgi:hypothetical protein
MLLMQQAVVQMQLLLATTIHLVPPQVVWGITTTHCLVVLVARAELELLKIEHHLEAEHQATLERMTIQSLAPHLLKVLLLQTQTCPRTLRFAT